MSLLNIEQKNLETKQTYKPPERAAKKLAHEQIKLPYNHNETYLGSISPNGFLY